MNPIKMNQNLTERFVRIIAGGLLLLASTYLPMGLIWLWALTLAGLFFMLTGLAGYCPISGLLNINTLK